jgi:hypothetical protein
MWRRRIWFCDTVQQFLSSHHAELFARDALLGLRIAQHSLFVAPQRIHGPAERVDLAHELQSLAMLPEQIHRAVLTALDREPGGNSTNKKPESLPQSGSCLGIRHVEVDPSLRSG